MKWLQLRCGDSDATTASSGNTSANCTMRRKLRTPKLRPYSRTNCVDSVDTICSPYSARSFLSTSLRMRKPTCQYSIVTALLAVCAMC